MFGVHASDRAVALSEQLVRAHQTLRERLASVREEVAGGSARPAIPGDLLSHCLSFCTAIGTHHTGEDSRLFPALRAAAPELAPTIDKLMEDHALVAGILQQVRALLAPDRPAAAPGALLRELDGLTAILESHFSFEERRVAAALDILGPEAWTADIFAPGM
jgi:Hemerythrin HHE cation binding domain